MRPVVDDDTTRPVHAHDKLVELVVCVCTPNGAFRHVKEQEVSTRNERQLVAELGVGQRPARVGHDGDRPQLGPAGKR
jgi:hypothetical protein